MGVLLICCAREGGCAAECTIILNIAHRFLPRRMVWMASQPYTARVEVTCPPRGNANENQHLPYLDHSCRHPAAAGGPAPPAGQEGPDPPFPHHPPPPPDP